MVILPLRYHPPPPHHLRRRLPLPPTSIPRTRARAAPPTPTTTDGTYTKTPVAENTPSAPLKRHGTSPTNTTLLKLRIRPMNVNTKTTIGIVGNLNCARVNYVSFPITPMCVSPVVQMGILDCRRIGRGGRYGGLRKREMGMCGFRLGRMTKHCVRMPPW